MPHHTHTLEQSEDLIDDLLPGNQEQALLALLTHASIKEAAEAAGVSETTMWRYMKYPPFAKRHLQARRQLLSQVIQRLQHDAGRAAEILREIAEDKSAPAHARVSACRNILDRSIKAFEVFDLQERVQELEDTLESQDAEEGAAY